MNEFCHSHHDRCHSFPALVKNFETHEMRSKDQLSNANALPRRVFNAACGGEREAVIAWLDEGGHINALCTWEEEEAIRCAVLLQAAVGLGQLELVRELLQLQKK